eukprot:1225341-Alexandrium_andersonii.AAC.1
MMRAKSVKDDVQKHIADYVAWSMHCAELGVGSAGANSRAKQRTPLACSAVAGRGPKLACQDTVPLGSVVG